MFELKLKKNSESRFDPYTNNMGALLMTKVTSSGKVIDLVNKMDALFMTGITSSSGKSTHKNVVILLRGLIKELHESCIELISIQHNSVQW